MGGGVQVALRADEPALTDTGALNLDYWSNS